MKSPVVFRCRVAVLALALAAGACGRSDLPFAPDGQLAPGSSDAGAGFDTGVGPDASCSGDGGLPLVGQQQNSGIPMVWFNRGCIDVTYDPSEAPELPAIKEALRLWSAPSCTWLCFTAPHPSSVQPSSALDRRLHFMPQAQGIPAPGGVGLMVDGSGEILSSEVYRVPGSSATPGDLIHLVGGAVGFWRTPNVDSVLNDAAPSPRTGLSGPDLQAVCAAYPGCK